MIKLRFAFKTLHFLLLRFFFGGAANHLGDTNRGIQVLHVETSGRLFHRQRKEAAGFEPLGNPLM